MAAKRKTTAKRTAKRRTTASKARRKPITRKPRRGGLGQRAAIALATAVARHGEKHTAVRQSRRDAAILRITHAGCDTCGGTGTLYTKRKDGSFSGSKPCPAKPKTMKVSRTRIALASRIGADKTSGLCGWRCPCGKSEKPRYRDAKAATAALRTHERRVHGGATVGGTWYAQIPAGATQPTATKTAHLSRA